MVIHVIEHIDYKVTSKVFLQTFNSHLMNKTFTAHFRIKKPKNYSSGPVPIYMRVTVDGERFEFHTRRECDPEKWGDGKMIGNKGITFIFWGLALLCK